MNWHTFYKEIEALRKAVEAIRDAETGLLDAQNKADNDYDNVSLERDITILHIAAELVERTLPPK